MTRFFLSNLSNSLIMEDPSYGYNASGPRRRHRIRPGEKCHPDRRPADSPCTEGPPDPAVPLPPSPLSYIRAKKILRQQLHERQLLARRRLVNSLYTREE